MRRWVLDILWRLATRRGRRRTATAEDYAAQTYRSQTRQMGVSLTDRIRDAFRPKWLRLRK